ncbi:unnamed protein product [Boreogadus saida]
MSSARWNPVTVPITGRRAGPSGNQSVTEKQPSVLSVGGQNPDGMKTSFKAWDGLDAECSCGSSTDCITLFRAFPPVGDLREDAALWSSDHYN